jgi:transcription initiation factor TFIIB
MEKLVRCSSCESDKIVTDYESGETICGKCGLVIYDIRQECTYRSNIDSKDSNDFLTSVGTYDSVLTTIIGKPNVDASGHMLDATNRLRMERLRMWDHRIKAVRRSSYAFHQLDVLQDKLCLPRTVVERTAYIYRKAQKRGLIRGRMVTAVMDAALYISCREFGIPKSLKEIARVNNIKPKTLGKSYRLLINELEIKTPTIDPTKCIIKVSNILGLEEKTKRKAIEIMNHLKTNEVTAGKDPMGMAATVVYMVCSSTGDTRTQTDIARIAGITEMTLRNRYKEIKCYKIELGKNPDLDLVPLASNT